MTSNELVVKTYVSGATVLLAMNLKKKATKNLAGFAILCAPTNKPSYYLDNRINFKSGAQSSKNQWTPSNIAPFQKFRWVHVLQGRQIEGIYNYTVTAMYFTSNTKLIAGASTSVSVNLSPPHKNAMIGFTRGYISSQAYVDKFNNKPIRPVKKTLDFDTTPYQDQYKWLGGQARKLLFSFLAEALKDPSITIDLFAYDLDEPDFIKKLQKLKGRLRAILDNASLHTKPGALEIEAASRLKESAGEKNVLQGHFKRFAHSKVLIQKKLGRPIKVLTGSANFSIRGFYVQANNILVFNNPQIADKYEEAFQTAFTDMKNFQKSQIASQWFDFHIQNLPSMSIAFSPHISANVSLDSVEKSIKEAKTSILFSVMSLRGSGSILESLRNLISRKNIFSYGISQMANGLDLFKPGNNRAKFAAFAYLNGSIPENFKQEWSGGSGQTIHHKFIVVDFNGDNPIVFTGSSNLAAGV
ncbi:MAG: phospholipase D-like domain-containing protein [Rickettsia endosymbiont of Ixodes persulcatus]|nr:phospholipase D-like domain-containing protein [Rickettsia endosymbiont of Ixodes persulcatus]